MNAAQAELVERYLDDSLDAAGLETLLSTLRSDPEFRKEFADALRLGGLLHAGIGPDPSGERLAEVVLRAIPSGGRALDSKVMEKIQERGLQPGRSDRYRWARVAALAAASFAVAIGLWIALRRPADAQLVTASPDVSVERGDGKLAFKPGLPLRTGDQVVVPANGWAWVRYADATTLQLGPGTSLTLEGQGLPPDQKRVRVNRGVLTADVVPQQAGRPMLLVSPHAESRVLGTTLTLNVSRDATTLLVRHGRVAITKSEDQANVEVASGQAATAAKGRPLTAEPMSRELLRKLGKDHFMLGVMSVLGETWVADTRAQGARWDLRYQHLTAGWTHWNQKGEFASLYLQESERTDALAVFTYYGLLRTSPGKLEGGVASEIARVCGDATAMQKYFADLRLFMQRAGAYGKPLILHVEPAVWAQFLTAPEFHPNVLEKVHVMVRSAGLPEFEALDDSAASFGRAFSVLRDRHAPNVLLAWHVSKVDGVSPEKAAEALYRCGSWDLLFTDIGDRDAAYKEARGISGGWWKGQDFDEFRQWGAQVHAKTGLPLMVWRIPLGNTRMAACNNTPWHYMDNKAEYWLEEYPSNKHIAEWAEAGFIGLLFGGGTHECTVHRDNAKDGVTNPAPVAGNRGEQTTFPDDDGGYLRLRAGSYYKNGPFRLAGN